MNSKKKLIAILIACLVTSVAASVALRMPAPAEGNATSQMQMLTGSSGYFNINPIFNPAGNKIAFLSNKTGTYEIWTLNVVDGVSRLTQITYLKGNITSPTWSPDGSKIAFLLSSQGQTNIWIVNVEKGTEADLTNNSLGKESFCWNPTGNMIVYDGLPGQNSNWTVSTVDMSGNKKQLTSQTYDSMYPTWSPNGAVILFSSTRTSSYFHIWSMKPDGTGMRQLTNGSYNQIEPQISPPNNRVLMLNGTEGSWQLWVMDMNGSNLFQPMYPPNTLGWEPVIDVNTKFSWDPNGTRILFSALTPMSNKSSVFIIQPPGYDQVVATFDYGTRIAVFYQNEYGTTVALSSSLITRLSTPESKHGGFGVDSDPCWNPDGKSVVFQSNQSGSFNIWLATFVETPFSSYSSTP